MARGMASRATSRVLPVGDTRVSRPRPDFLAYDIRDLPSRFAAMQRLRGIPVASWTVRSPDLLARARIHADAPIVEGAGVPQTVMAA